TKRPSFCSSPRCASTTRMRPVMIRAVMMQNIHAGKNDPITSTEGTREQLLQSITARQINQVFPSLHTTVFLLILLRTLGNGLRHRRLLTQQISRGIVEIGCVDPDSGPRLHNRQPSLGKLILRR